MNKTLIIRMLEMGDVASIAVPAIRHIQKHNPNSELTCLTHGQGKQLLALAEPEIKVLTLADDFWPDNILQALEVFLGMAEQIIEIKYDQIINLDTAFMPCFLARFLKDAGEPVKGNFLSVSLQTLIEQIQNQSLQSDYVNHAQNYLQSTFFGMFKWHTQWWTADALPENGYPEFYLKNCCGFTDLKYDTQLLSNLETSNSASQKTVYVALDDPHMPYLHLDLVVRMLSDQGIEVILDDEASDLTTRLQKLAASDLVVCFANAIFALANSVGTPTLLVPMQLDPRILMPDYAIDESLEHPLPEDFAASIVSIFESQ